MNVLAERLEQTLLTSIDGNEEGQMASKCGNQSPDIESVIGKVHHPAAGASHVTSQDL